MIRIAIATLALTMIVVPMLVLGASPVRQATISTARAIPVSQDEAVALAKARGLVRVSTIAFENGVWILHGAARDGGLAEIDVSSAGEVLNSAS